MFLFSSLTSKGMDFSSLFIFFPGYLILFLSYTHIYLKIARPLGLEASRCGGGKVFFTLMMLAMWSSGRHLALGSEGPGSESWLCQVKFESLGKGSLHAFPHPTHV